MDASVNARASTHATQLHSADAVLAVTQSVAAVPDDRVRDEAEQRPGRLVVHPVYAHGFAEIVCRQPPRVLYERHRGVGCQAPIRPVVRTSGDLGGWQAEREIAGGRLPIGIVLRLLQPARPRASNATHT
jgi:hypothetical protein